MALPAAAVAPWYRRRAPTVAAAVLLALAGAVALGEWAGWPFLAAPVQRLLSDALDRPVRVSAAAPTDSAAAAAGLRTRFIGGLRLRAARLEIGAPAWSDAPHLLRADDVRLQLRYGDLWRAHRGGPLQVRRLQANTLDLQLERHADGRASWQFGPRPAADPDASAPAVPRFGHLSVRSGSVRLRDAPAALDVSAQLALVDGSATGSASSLTLHATGTHRRRPLRLELVAGGVLPWVADDGPATPVPLRFDATVGRATLVFRGQAADLLHQRGLAGRFTLTGPSLAAVGDPLGVTLPSTAAFRAVGGVVKQTDAWRVRIDDATVGASRLGGAFSYETGRAVPLLAGRLTGRRLLLSDLGPVVGTTPAVAAATDAPLDDPSRRRAGKVLPDRPFDLPALRAMDANVLIDIAEVDLESRWLEPLRPLRAHLQLTGGVLDLADLDARTGQGRLMGDLQLDGRRPKALWRADLRWGGVRLERWIRQPREGGAPPYVTGVTSGRTTLTGQGRSTATILASLNGELRGELRDGTVSHLAVEAAGLDLAQSLGVMLQGDDALPVRCAVADLGVQAGVVRPRLMVLDTADSALWLDGSLSLASEALDLRVLVMPRDFSPLAVRSPLRVRGTLSSPEVSLERGTVAARVAGAVLLALLNPLAGVIPLLDPGDAEAAARSAAGCRDLATRRGGAPR